MISRREIARRLGALQDIAGVMSAMKGLALTETHALRDFLASQQRMLGDIETAAADLLDWHAGLAAAPVAGRELCVVVGSEQGFCGDFNEALAARVRALRLQPDAPTQWVLVGRRLAERMGVDTRTVVALPGAVVAGDVTAVLRRLTFESGRLLALDVFADHGLSALYHCDAVGDVRLRRVLPIRDLPAPARRRAYPPDLNLPARDVLAGLVHHYLQALLTEILFGSLMVENRRRLTHMDRALQRLDEDIARLQLARNRARQEEIVEEIEVILLSAEMLAPEAGAR
jgi:F-type H+-transporting ATPase subunit gamma